MVTARNYIRLLLCWLAYRFVLLWPLDWWPTMQLLPYVGEYAHAESRECFFANAARLRSAAPQPGAPRG